MRFTAAALKVTTALHMAAGTKLWLPCYDLCIVSLKSCESQGDTSQHHVW